jgi:hypothetical protein
MAVKGGCRKGRLQEREVAGAWHHFSLAISSGIAPLEPRLELCQDLFVRRTNGGRRGSRGSRPRLEVQHQVEQDLQRTRIGGRYRISIVIRLLAIPNSLIGAKNSIDPPRNEFRL